MAISIPKPSADGVMRLHKQLIDEWTERFDQDKRLSDLIHRRNIIDSLSEDERRSVKAVQIHTGRAGGIIEHSVGLLMTTPSFKVKPSKLGSKAALEADRVEAMVAKIFETQMVETDFWRALGRTILSYGRGLIKVLPLPVVWTPEVGYPTRGAEEDADAYLGRVRDWKEEAGEFPLSIQHIPVMNALLKLDANDKPLACIEEKVVPACIVAEEMGSSTVRSMISKGDLDWYDDVLCVEYTDPKYVGYYLVNTDKRSLATEISPYSLLDFSRSTYEELRTFEHGLGKCPVVFFPGIRTELHDKAGRFKSFIDDAVESLEAYDMLISRLGLMVWAYYMPSYIWKINQSAAIYDGRERPTLKIELGGVTPEMIDEQIRPLDIPSNLPDAVLLTREVDDLIQRHTLEDVLFGRVNGSAPAFQVNLRINVAKSKLSDYAEHMAAGLTEVIDLVFASVGSLGEELVLSGESINPTQAKLATGRVGVSIEPKSPQDLAQDFGIARMAQEFGLPDQWIMENLLKIEDAGIVKLMSIVEQLEKTPDAMAPILAEALDQLGMSVQAEQYEPASPNMPDLANLPPAAQQALAQLLGQVPTPGMGNGPFPVGAAPQTIQGGRGLNTPKTQPQPSAAGVTVNGQ